MQKKILSVLLSLVLLVAVIPAARAASFPDVDSNADYAAAVANVSEYGIIIGDAKGNFNPNQIVSRAEMATIICRMLGKTEGLQTSDTFTDVPADHWANAYVAKAAELGVVGGYGNGKFGPSDPVTYEQAVTMVIRAMGEDSAAAKAGGYPAGYLQTAEDRFLLEGVPGAQGQGMSRGAIAMLLNNYYTGCPAKPGDGHTHHYVEKTMPGSGSGSGGHYEQKQVQVGTKTVDDYGDVTIYGCGVCSFTTYDGMEVIKHTDPHYEESKKVNGGHMGANWWSETKKVVVGTHEEPNYETRTTWVAGSGSTITVSVCALCGQME